MKTTNAPATVLITGCSSGYGLATARHFHAQGWNVIATMRTPRAGVLPPAERLRILALDVTRPESIAAALEAAGPVDVVVNNAGIGVVGAFEATPMATVREVFETNTFGVMALTHAVLPQFRARKSGVIVNVTSSVTLAPMPLAAVYTGSKMAIEGFTASLAFELERADADQFAAARDQAGAAPVGMGGMGEDRFIEQVFPIAGELLLGRDLAGDRARAPAGAADHHAIADLRGSRRAQRQRIQIEVAERLHQAEAGFEIEAEGMAFHHAAVAAMIKSNERLAMKLTKASEVRKDIEAVYKAGMDINYLPSMPSAASIYDKSLR